MPKHILIVDDEQSMRDFLSIFLRKQGYEVGTAEDGPHALEAIQHERYDLVITDVRMGEMTGIDLLKKAKQIDHAIEFIVMTAYSSTSDAIIAMKDGAYDYITKPFKLDEIKVTIQKALEKRDLKSENVKLKSELKRRSHKSNIVGKSKAMAPVFDRIEKVANTKTTVLISGESGTGKELVARAIHYDSDRSQAPFVTINCGAIPADLMESELFGHTKGSFTGAVRDKEGLFVIAANGTLFLDEIGEMPLHLQVKLLRVLQEKQVMPVGGAKQINIDTRVIAATNRDLLDEVKHGRFREDLYYRLNVIQIRLPPLRERKDDLPLLVQHLVKRACKEIGREPMRVSEAAMMILENHDYPGNVRELSNLVERAVALETTDQIRPESLPAELLDKIMTTSASESPPVTIPVAANAAPDLSVPIDLDEVLARTEKRYINEALDVCAGVKTEAAKLLGISFRSLRYRLKKLGIETEQE